jgi:hypothetical protein
MEKVIKLLSGTKKDPEGSYRRLALRVNDSFYTDHTKSGCIVSHPCIRKGDRMFAVWHAIHGGSLSSGNTYDRPVPPPMSDREKSFISQAFSSFFFLPNIYPFSFLRRDSQTSGTPLKSSYSIRKKKAIKNITT